MIDKLINELKKEDEEIACAIELEYKRQKYNIELIASENIVSKAVLKAMSTPLTNKYAEGYPSKRYYGGCEYVDQVEEIGIERACKLFNCDYANIQPHSGASANMAVIFAICEVGDTILSMSLENGGHLSHGSPVNMTGKNYNVISYKVDENGFIDYDTLESLAIKHKPKLIIAGASAYPRKIDFKKFRDIADKSGSVLMADIAHIAGLVATNNHMSPFPYADVVTTTTHKTLRGPRGGMILSNKKANEKYNFNKAIFPGIQGGPLMHIIAAKAIALKEALSSDFKIYQDKIIKNAKSLSQELINQGFELVSGGTDNHLMLIDLTNIPNLTGKEMQLRGDNVNITINKNTIPNEPRSPFITSGVRLGTPAITSRGFDENDMKKIAELLYLTATKYEQEKENIKEAAINLCKKHPLNY